ncbi:MAG: UDP-2,4-diacetamido-2,4,6-trideoxy-beta-L-altropyranose hydrolase [Candidatus Omnitrophica bacterium]|nr:UDP-2,4-diacetamido-2,4,6-trideoxy-beta-L-altropyranose hydrolase [Candidatus Omnitrophota bacterium]
MIRADANAGIGVGHVMRCLSLAQAWRDEGGDVVFASAPGGAALDSRLFCEKMKVERLSAPAGSYEDARETLRLACEAGASWIVIDGYRFGADYQTWIKDSGRKLLCIDDFSQAEHYCADLLLNQNIYANEEMYSSREPYTKLLLGLSYALLRREFVEWRAWRRDVPNQADRILVTLGGGDPDNVTELVIRALQSIPAVECKIVIGSANPHRDSLKTRMNRYGESMQLLTDVQDMPALAAWADLAISAGGGTCWELAFMGLPNLAVVIADNQKPIADHLQKAGISISLGWRESLTVDLICEAVEKIRHDYEKRFAMSRAGRTAVDGLGASRAVKRMKEI